MTDRPLSRQPACHWCEPHEAHLLVCECGCLAPIPGMPDGIMEALRSGGGPRDAGTSEGLVNT